MDAKERARLQYELDKAMAEATNAQNEMNEAMEDRAEAEKEYHSSLASITKKTSDLEKAVRVYKNNVLNSSVSLIEEITSRVGNIAANKKYKEKLQEELKGRKNVVSALQDQKKIMEEQRDKQFDLIQASKALGKSKEELAAANEKLTQMNDDIKSQNEELIEAEKKQKKIQEEIDNQLNRSKKQLISSITKVSSVMLSINNTIRETQKQFGVAASQAGKIQFGSLVESVQSLGSDVFVTSQEIMNAQSAFQEQFGGIITSDAASALAQEAKQLGITTQQMAAARRVFMTQTMGNLSSANAQQDMFIQEFRDKGLTAKDAMESIINNSELMARNGTRFATSFARAAADAKKIGVDLGKVDQIGDNIIGDFEGFLEKQAELGAMGFGFDSFRLGQVAETGDTGALMEELRSQLAATGKDLTNLRRSEQLALSSAFGIPMAELQRMAGPTAGSGEQTEPIDVTNDWLSKIFNWIEKGAVFASMAASLVTIAGSSVATAFNTGILAGKSALGGIGRGASAIGRGVASVGRGVAAAGSVAAGATAATAATAIGGLAGGMYIGDRINEATGSATLGDFWKYNVRGGANDRREQEAMEARVRELRAQRPVQPGTIERAQRQTQQSQSADIAELSKKLDQVVRAIGSMEVRMDGNKVGQVIVGSEQRVTTSAPFRAART